MAHPIHAAIDDLDKAFTAVREHIRHDETVIGVDHVFAVLRGHLAVHARDLEVVAENAKAETAETAEAETTATA